MNEKIHFLKIFLLLISISYSDQLKSKEYKFIHYDGCTGICEFIVQDKKIIPILFSSNSDSNAIKTLRSLKPQVFLYNTSKRNSNLYIIGELDVNKKRAGGGNDLAELEEYYEFKILSWYLITPFLFANYNEIKDITAEIEIIKREHLKPSDFNTNDLKLENADLLKFTRQRMKEGAQKK